MNASTALMMMAASIAPQDYIVDQLQECIDEYRKAILESEKKQAIDKLTTICSIQLTKSMQQTHGVATLMEDVDKMEKSQTLLHPGKQ